ncbi:MAG: hypothetical protein ABSF78_15255 [Candidatus Acidiferrales bacterium]
MRPAWREIGAHDIVVEHSTDRVPVLLRPFQQMARSEKTLLFA